MQTLDELEPLRSWDELLAHAHRRGSTIRRRYAMVRIGMVAVAVAVTVIVPLSYSFRAAPSPDVGPDTPGEVIPTPFLPRIIDPRPLGQAPPAHPFASPGPILPGARPTPKSTPSSSRPLEAGEQRLFADAPGDVRTGAGTAASNGAVDLIDGTAVYTDTALTLTLTVADLEDTANQDMCWWYTMDFVYRGITLEMSASRPGGACKGDVSLSWLESGGYPHAIPTKGRFDWATNSMLVTATLSDLNGALPERNDAGAPVPRVSPGDRFTNARAETIALKKFATYGGSGWSNSNGESGGGSIDDPRNHFDSAAG